MLDRSTVVGDSGIRIALRSAVAVAVAARVRVKEGLPHPRGATWDGKGVNFSLFSANATKVEVCLFNGRGEREIERIELPEYTNEIWHGWMPDIGPGTIY